MNNDILNNLLNGASKSLHIIDEVIPIYKDTSPLIKKIKNYTISKNAKYSIQSKESNKIKKEKSSEIKKNLDLSSDNEPKFFL